MTTTEADLTWLRTWIERTCANRLGPEKNYLIKTRLSPVVRQFELKDLGALIAQLKRSSRGQIADAVVDAVTTNETSFFRDVSFFRALEDKIIPHLIEGKRAEQSLGIWSAASSTGQEIYSVAMLLRDRFPELMGWEVKLYASDISPQAIFRAKEGIYSPLEVGRGLPRTLKSQFLRPVAGGGFQVDQRVRDMVEFHRVNLDHAWPPFGKLDLIMVRNVLIYFEDDIRKRVLERASRQLTPTGLLVLGAQERPPDSARLTRNEEFGYPTFRGLSLLDALGGRR
jgi:chemotaxis protein methyltransferase CheR